MRKLCKTKLRGKLHTRLCTKRPRLRECFLFHASSSSVAINASTPIARASCFFAVVREIATTRSHPARAQTAAQTPMIPTRVPGPAPFFSSGAYTVMPLHSIGAVAALLSASGILTTKCTGTRTRSLYPPWLRLPLPNMPWYVPTNCFAPWFSCPALHSSQSGRRQLAAGALRPDSCDALDDLVLDAHGVFSGRPPGAQRVDVVAADAAVRDADVDVGCGEM